VIFVDSIQRGRAPWKGGAYSHMTSDSNVGELLDFALSLGLRLAWFQHPPRASHPHYDIAPGVRARALRAGAVAVTRREYVAAVHRLKERNPQLWIPSPPV